MQKQQAHNFKRGFTLVELMTVVVIVGILGALAVPMYRDYMERSRLSMAKTILQEAAQHVERGYALNNRYLATIPTPLTKSPKIGEGTAYFTISYATDGSSYRLKAVVEGTYLPRECRALILTSNGNKFAYDTTGPAITATTPSATSNAAIDTKCWLK